MNRIRLLLLTSIALLTFNAKAAAPDEDSLGKAAGYPAAHSLRQAYREPYIVGSFSAMDTFNPSCALAPAVKPLPLPKASAETSFHYRYGGRTLTLDDYMQRQRATGLLVVKDGEIVAERYNYERTGDMRMLSNSMAKTITALGIVKAQEEGLIQSLDDSADTYVPELKGTLYGRTRIVNLMRMASGARYVENYSESDDRAKFNAIARRLGIAQAASLVKEREDRGNHMGADRDSLLRGIVSMYGGW